MRRQSFEPRPLLTLGSMKTPMVLRAVLFASAVSVMHGCNQTSEMETCDSLLNASPAMATLLPRASDLRLQVVVSWVARDAHGKATLSRSAFRADAEYFYPASTIKLCAAIAALSVLERWPCPVGRNTPLVMFPLFPGQQTEETDASNLQDRKITAGHEIRKLFLVSDNQSFNRLYDLVGQEQLNALMWNAGASSLRITHRLSEGRSMAENRRTRQIRFLGPGGEFMPENCDVPERTAAQLPPAPDIPGLIVGSAYLSSAGVLEKPMNFAEMNRVSIVDLQDILVMTVRPDIAIDPRKPGFDMTDESRRFLSAVMAEYPADSTNPRYDMKDFPDAYGKFLLPGLLRIGPRDSWLIQNKVGQAYGFTIENAYVESRLTGRACFVTAVIYTNEDGVLNDDRYEYETVALPFMANLGEAIGRELDK